MTISLVLISTLTSLDVPLETTLRKMAKNLPLSLIGALFAYFLQEKLMKGVKKE